MFEIMGVDNGRQNFCRAQSLNERKKDEDEKSIPKLIKNDQMYL